MVTIIPIVIGALRTIPKSWFKGLEDLESKITRDLPDYSILKIGQDTEKSPNDWRRLAVTQNPVENHRLTLV